MDKGKVAEFDSPYKLLVNDDSDNEITNTDTIFSEMVKNTGPSNAEAIF